jgi:hypothetical protein
MKRTVKVVTLPGSKFHGATGVRQSGAFERIVVFGIAEEQCFINANYGRESKLFPL